MDAADRNRTAARERYRRLQGGTVGPRGGVRPCPPGCSCRRHGALRRALAPSVAWEGQVARIWCPRCVRRIAGTFTEEEVDALLSAHRHRERTRPMRTQTLKEVG